MRQLLQKYTGIFCVLLLLLINAIDSHAQSVTVIREALDSSRIAVNDSIVVTDEVYFDTSKLRNLETPYNVKNIVTFKINEYSKLYLPAAFSASVTIRITYTTPMPDAKTDTLRQTLTINYKSTDAYTNRSSFVFKNAHRVKVEVLGLNITSEKNILPALTLENEMQVHPVYKLDSTDAVKELSDNRSALTDTSDELTVSWKPVEGADDYDLEWTHIDSSALYIYGNPIDPEAIFRNNATRVTVTDKTYNIPLMYDEPGVIFYRVRAVQERDNYVRKETIWSSKYNGGLGQFGYNGHERKLNWQSAISFAEDGKRKVVVNYFDGSLHSRQTVTKDNTTNTAVVAETMYDYQGRPVIQVMPAPTLSNAVKYFSKFNTAVNGAEYDKNQYDTLASVDDYLTGGAAPMSSLSGANQYYSSNNPESNQGVNRYLPNANGYAFTQTEYTPDNTGRISRQSGVGDVFKLGSNHETRYYYGTPSQEELDFLFGTDVGDKTHYFKNSVKDANGQVSISYVDMHGRTIATALAGRADSGSLNGLPGVNTLTYLDTLSRPGSNLLKDLTLETVESKVVAVEATYTYHYKLNTPSVKILDPTIGILVNCPVRYDLYITITDDANNQRLPGKKAYERVFRNYTAGTDPTISSTVQNIDVTDSFKLSTGSYTITKRLVVNSAALAYYRDSIYLSKTLYKTLDNFINDQRALLNTTECLPSCQACFVSIGTWENFRANYMSIGQVQDTAASRGAAWAAYQSAIEACNALCDSTAQTTNVLKQMLLDVTAPSGQYAVPEKRESPFSIFYSDTNVKLAPYQDTGIVYLDENGKKDTVYDEETDTWVIPQKLSPTQFGRKFKASWANVLLKYHPEYCKYLTYTKYKASYDWDDKFSKVDTYADAVSAGYLNPLGDSTDGNFTIITANVDPIKYTGIKDALKARMKNYLKDHPSDVSIYTMAMARVRCPADGKCVQTNVSPKIAFSGVVCTPDQDMAWRAFRESYKVEKHNLIDAVIDASSCPGIRKVSSAELIDSSYQPVFYVAEKAISEQAPAYQNPNLAADSVLAAMDSSYARNCRAYKADWYNKLIGCIDSVTLTTMILPRLEEVCKQGSDISHPFGSSTVAPGSNYNYKSFQAVLDAYFANRSLQAYTCNAYKITTPAPYDQQPAYYDVTLYSKPDDCQCTKLKALQKEYTVNGHDTNLAAYLARTRGISITQANLDLLLNSCNGNTTCINFSNPITIPPALQCYTGDICVNCSRVDTLYNAYIRKYPGCAPVRETLDSDSVQMAKNQLFENYMNVSLGFNKHYWEYIDFRNQCGSSNAREASIAVSYPITSGTYTCSNLQAIVSNFLTAHPVSEGTTLSVTKKVPLKTVTHIYNNGSLSVTSKGSLAAAVDKNNNMAVLRDNAVFNLDVIAKDAVISSGGMNLNAKAAQYEIYSGQAGYAHSNGFMKSILGNFERALGPVIAGTTNWSNQPSTTTDNSISVGPITVGYSNTSFADASCTGLVRDMFTAYKNGQNYGLIFKLDNENTTESKAIVFWGKTDTAIANPSFLNVTYTASRCEEFTAYVNEQLGTSYTTDQVDSLWQKTCGAYPGVCTYPSYDGPLLCGKSAAIFTTRKDTINNCSDSAFLVYSKGYDLYNNYKEVLKNEFDKLYRDTAIAGGLRELFTLGYSTSEYQYTLYYYDQAGNLTRTVPPEGVVIDRSATWKAKLAAARAAGTRWVPGHQMATEYRYNTLNQIVSKKTPDDSISNYWYDKLGRVVVSQNAKQSLAKNYSYTNYDALGRVVEVGEITSATAMTSTISRNEQSLANWFNTSAATRTQITKTVYDIAYYASDTILNQDNLRNRVSWMAIFDNAAALSTANGMDYASGTFYSYDIHGNVKSLLQDFKHGNMLINGNRFKTINYGYDLISGKVNYVAYQPGKRDAFYHRYSYDAENRLTNVATSHDSIYWENDAYYEYYKHGPLARAVIGQQQVQGIDYAYTLQGWLKGINSNLLRTSFDMGGDGKSGSQVAKDAFGFAIHYFDIRDYIPVNAAVKPFAAVASNRPLFNGNISGISQSISTIGTPLLYRYEYDVLNRLRAMLAAKGLDTIQNSWTNGFGTIQDFKELITYDRNGNILTYIRNGNKTFAGSPIGMDSLTYHYRPGTNKLSYVTDLVKGGNYGNDIDNQQIDNYQYDSIGNMVSDVRSGVDSIKWNVYGKIARIYKHDTTSIIYAYDAAGNRVSKSFINKSKDTLQTFYVRDATGNILSTYAYGDTSVNNGQLSQIEANLYGSSRLGMTTLATNVQDPTPTPKTNIVGLGYGENITFTRGKKFFELTNHLGNVLATVSDRKVGVSVNNTTIDSYNPVINSAQEYYPFGMLMPGRGGRIGAGRNVGGSTVIVGGDTIPATLVVNQRVGNTPGTYMATEQIDFVDGFNSGDGDSFNTLFVDQTSGDPGTESGVSYGIEGKGYRYGFNGKENDNEVKGEGNEQDYGMRVYDPRLGKFLSVDPLTKNYPELTPYQFASNRPIQGIDLDGGELKILTSWLADKAKASGHPRLSGFVNSFGGLDVNSIMYNRWKMLLTGDIEGAKKEFYEMTAIGIADNAYHLVKAAYNGNKEAQGAIIGTVVQVAFSKRLSGERGRVLPPDLYTLNGVSIGKVASRKAFAKQWFIDSGKMGTEVESLSETINYSNPVREKVLKVGDKIWRFERENATNETGNFYTDAYGADAGAQGVGLGDPKGYHLVEYQVTSETKVLESTIRSTGQKQFFSIDLNKNIKEVGREVAQ